MDNKIWSTFDLVFAKKAYIVLFLLITVLFFLVAIIIPGFSAAKFAWTYASPDMLAKVKSLGVIWPFFVDNSTVWGRWLTVIVSLLSGLNFSMLIFYLKRRISLEKSVGTGFIGMIVGILGIGCASCGSVILSSIFGLTAVTSFFGILPFGGKEIGILGILLLMISIYLLAKKIQNPNSCKISQ